MVSDESEPGDDTAFTPAPGPGFGRLGASRTPALRESPDAAGGPQDRWAGDPGVDDGRRFRPPPREAETGDGVRAGYPPFQPYDQRQGPASGAGTGWDRWEPAAGGRGPADRGPQADGRPRAGADPGVGGGERASRRSAGAETAARPRFRDFGSPLKQGVSYVVSTNLRYINFAILAFLGAITGLLALGWIRGTPLAPTEAWSFVILGYGAIGFFLLFLVSLIFLHWLTVWLTTSLSPESRIRKRTPLGEKLFHIITFFAAIWTGYTSFYGFQIVFFSPDEGLRYWLVPGLAGLIATGFVFAFWTTLMERLEVARIWQKVVMLMILAPLGAVMIFGLSTATSVLGVGGDTAVTEHMRVSIERMQVAMNDIKQARDREYERLLPMTAQVAARFERLAQQEEQQGVLTNAAGAGAVSNYLLDLAQVARGIGEQLEDQRRREAEETIGLLEDLRRLREALDDRGYSFRSNYESLIRDVNALQNRLGRVAAASPVETVRFLTETMREIRPLTAASVNAAFSRQQEAVVENLQQEKNATIDEIQKALSDLKSEGQVRIPDFSPMHDLKAILTYWQEIWLSWAIAIATDMGPFLWILVAAVMPSRSYIEQVRVEQQMADFAFLEDQEG